MLKQLYPVTMQTPSGFTGTGAVALAVFNNEDVPGKRLKA